MAGSEPESGTIAQASSEESVFLSLVIPAYNEEARLPASLTRALEHLRTQTFTFEIVVVENASSDGTFEVAQEAAARDERVRVLREPRRGKGAAVRRGMLEARGTYRFLCDADFSMPVEEIQRFLPPVLTGIDVAVGSREAAGAVRYEEPAHRHLMGRVFNALVRGLLVGGVQDTQCGFKCFSAEAAEAIFPRVTRAGFSFDVEALVIAQRQGFVIAEVPVPWHYDGDSRVRLVADSVGMAVDLLVIAWNARRGRYDAG